jgi:nucleotide-binding universal stress UspA family protein
VWWNVERWNNLTESKWEQMMQSSTEVEKSPLSDWRTGPALESFCPAGKIRQIIVPVDLTNDCTASIDYAIRFAKAFGSTVNLLHLYQDPYVVSQSSRSPNWDLFKEQRRMVFADFYNLLRETRSKYPDAKGYFEYGNPDREIDVIARQLRADLLIVSMHHGKWLEHLLFGRHAARILANAPCPVLVVRDERTDLIGRQPQGF